MNMQICEDQKEQGRGGDSQSDVEAHKQTIGGRVTGTYCVFSHSGVLITFTFSHYIKVSLYCLCLSPADRHCELRKQVCRCHFHGDYYCPFAPLLLAYLYPIMLCAASHSPCVFSGLYRLHSLSRVHSHWFCGLPGKQEDPPPQMVQKCPYMLFTKKHIYQKNQ